MEVGVVLGLESVLWRFTRLIDEVNTLPNSRRLEILYLTTLLVFLAFSWDRLVINHILIIIYYVLLLGIICYSQI